MTSSPSLRPAFELSTINSALRSPLAIVGIGCRFPGGGHGPERFWQLLCDEVDAISDLPRSRWSADMYFDAHPGTPGRSAAARGGFIEGIDEFDPDFFGISRREANSIDPQQRLLLEVAWETFEDAGATLAQVKGSRCGVFIGLSNTEYGNLDSTPAGLLRTDTYSNTGAAMSLSANRISYSFDLHGPSFAVDTACSSALVAVHAACQSLWDGECTSALAGGVNALLRPQSWVGMSRLAMLSPDAHCKAFDASANGFVRSEGAGLVMLKPLADAQRDDDRIYGVIRGTACNQDGHTTGITVPSEHAQADLVRAACHRAGIAPRDVGYVEAHGTGTLVGDPIECRALGTVLGQGRESDDRLWIGSVKTNIGHLESAAGIAGLIKATLAVYHRQIPANLHFHTPNPDIPFDELGLRVPRELTPWPQRAEPAIAAVNSFGFGGTNAHVILSAAPATDSGKASQNRHTAAFKIPAEEAPPRLIPLSARSPEALKAQARQLAARLTATGDWNDVCYTLARRRTHHAHRAALVARTPEEAAQTLLAFADGGSPAKLVQGRIAGDEPSPVVFVFSGQGTQFCGMVRELLAHEPVFRTVMEECDRLLAKHADWSLLDELAKEASTTRLDQTAIAQPAIFAVQVALARLWQTWGIVPSAVVGHSVGEVAAAYVSGILTLEDAVRIIYHRGRCMDVPEARGKMLAVALPLEEVRTLIAGREHEISLAAVNSPSTMTLSGSAQALEAIAIKLEQRSIFHTFLKVEYAFHSPCIDGQQGDLQASIAGMTLREETIPFYSGVQGQRVTGSLLTPEYWWDSVRHTVQFSQAITALLNDGFETFIELAAHGVLLGPVMEIADAHGTKVSMVHALRRDADQRESLLKCAGSLFVKGASLNWSTLAPEGRLLTLPGYAWQHERFWNETNESHELRVGQHYHRLLGYRIPGASPLWENHLDVRIQRFLADHCVQGYPVVPAAAYVEMAATAARSVLDTATCILDDVQIHKACFLRQDQTVCLQLAVNAAEGSFQIVSRPVGNSPDWTEHVTGRFRPTAGETRWETQDLDRLRLRLPTSLSADDCYRNFRDLGLEYGPCFQCLDGALVGTGEALGSITAPAALQPFLNGYHIHPAILDACFQTVICLIPRETDVGVDTARMYLPVEFQQLRVLAPLPASVLAHARLVSKSSREMIADLTILDRQGRTLVEISGLRCQAVDGLPGERTVDVNDWVFEYRWKPQALENRESANDSSGVSIELGDVAASVKQSFSHQFAGMPTDRRLIEISQQVWPLCTEFILRAWSELGLDIRPGNRFRAESLSTQLGILPRHTRLTNRYVQFLEAAGALRRVGDEHEFLRGLDPDAIPQSQLLWRQNPDCYPDLSLLHRIGEKLGPVLAGTAEPLELLFPHGNMSLAEWYYQDSPGFRFTNTRLQMAVCAVARQWPVGRPLRILEVGAGTGAFTSFVLPELARLPCEVHYTFTDLSDAFLMKARERFGDFSFIKYSKLDLEQDPLAQGYEPHSFDMVVASQVLHATADLEVTLRHLRTLLTQRGLLAFVEFVNEDPIPILDIVFGVLEGWWRFTDLNRRPDYPTLPRARWHTVLNDCGFSHVTEAAGNFTGSICAVLMAQSNPQHEPAASRPVALPETELPRVSTTPPATGRWLIFCDRGGLGRRLADKLRARGAAVQTVVAGKTNRRVSDDEFELIPADKPGMQWLLADLHTAGNPPCGVVHLWSCDDILDETDSLESVAAGLAPGCLTVTQLLQGLAESAAPTPPRAWLITRGAQTAGDGPAMPQPLQGSLWGLGRVAMNELRNLRPILVDLSPEPSDGEFEALVAEFLANSHEEEVALRGASRYVHRLIRTAGRRPAPRQLGADGNTTQPRFRLETSRQGTFDQLVLRGQPPAELPPGSVEIAIEASALNFSDVMKALGLYPGLPDGPIPMGLEFAGRITRIAPGVQGWQIADAVMGLAPFSFASYVITDSRYIAKLPTEMTFEQAATLPVAYLTAYYALHSLGKIRRGERVLIHAATGGVGLAAIQLAQVAGAEVFATAGTPEKRDFLRWMGIPHVMDSRTLSFADEVLAATNGEGVDLILNSLSGQAIQKSLSLLRDYGRFLEIGKRDIYADSRLAMRPFRRNLSFHAIDLDGAMRQRPEIVGEVFAEMAELVQRQQISVIPYRPFRLSNISAAFRYMAQARHIGKVVITHSEPELEVLAATKSPYRYRADVTYLITGGLGGLGLAIAKGMVRDGARHIVLMQRSGPSHEATAELDELRGTGAEMIVEQADVTQPSELAAVLARIAASVFPLAGVMHLAMVLDDGLLVTLDAERFERVWSPKVLGAWNLHLQTRTLPLDFFVNFSSISSLLGMEGQGNYAAANAFLDSLATFRRAQNLPALTINWGYLGEVGWVARHPEIAQRFESLGMQGIRPHEVLSMMGRFINDGSVQVGVVGSGANEFVRLVAGQSLRFEDLGADDGQAGGKKREFGSGRAALMAVEPEQRRGVLETLLKEQVSRVLGTTPDRLDVTCPLTDMGLDSLVAVELKNWTEGELGLQLPTVELLRGPSVAQLVDLLAKQLEGDAVVPVVAPPVNVDELSDAQVDEMLASIEGEAATVN